jgi:uncharacterized OB-fold protein
VQPPFPTRSLSDAEFREGVVTVSHALRAGYAWDAGVAIGAYLEGLKAGKILGRSCRRCGRVLVPPRMYCEQCFRPTDAWVEVPPTGRVATFSVCSVTWDMRPLTVPELPAVIELGPPGPAGPGPFPGILHTLGEVDPSTVSIGMAVEAVWKPAGEREGSILDIRHWRPTQRGPRSSMLLAGRADEKKRV